MSQNPIVRRLRTRAALAAGTATLAAAGLTAGLVVGVSDNADATQTGTDSTTTPSSDATGTSSPSTRSSTGATASSSPSSTSTNSSSTAGSGSKASIGSADQHDSSHGGSNGS